MKVENESAYKLIFSIQHHPFLGAVIEPFVVELTTQNTLSLTYQKVFSGNAGYYTRLSREELDLIAILDPIMVEQIIKLFSPEKKIRPKEFFQKYFSQDLYRDEIRPYVEIYLVALLKRLDPHKHLLYRADDINPAAERIEVCTTFSKVLFHFRRNEMGTKYFATIKYLDERLPFMKIGALLLSNQPAYLLVQQKLLKFYDFVEGNKLAVFLNRKYVLIKPEQEKEYYSAFVSKLLERSPVYAEGFEIRNEEYTARAILFVNESKKGWRVTLKFKYGSYLFEYHPTKNYHVHLEYIDGNPVFTRIKCSRPWENHRQSELEELGWKFDGQNSFVLGNGSIADCVSYLSKVYEKLEMKKYQVEFESGRKYTLDVPRINYTIKSELDWFDLNIEINIGTNQIYFKQLLPYIKNGDHEFPLEDGSYFIIPEEWFTLGQKLSHSKTQANHFLIAKFQLDLLEFIKSDKIKEHLKTVQYIKEEHVSKSFKGKLRPYQIEGLSWLMFLHKNRFGGILADDMGLGKTVQTLAYLLKIQEEFSDETDTGLPSLLVAPTSLLHNWEQEALLFTPKIKTYVHSGINRKKSLTQLKKYNLIITSYGLIRNDFELFSEIEFRVIILDESQHIKNQAAKSTQLINKLQASHKLCLSGTPIENSIKDLWSQMNFLNKGLLGSAKQFEAEYVKPIEKKNDIKQTEKLQKLVKPFVLRRTKGQVAKDLPALTEKTIYCEMTEEQKKWYEEIKSEYRNSLLNIVEQQGLEKSKLSILQGLTKLRQLANHPKLVIEDYIHSSGKHDTVLQHIETVVSEGHKVLVFSQFVSYLNIIAKDLQKAGISFLTLTGSTPVVDRKHLVKKFQEEDSHRVFIISLKAGGVGLNLTAADYVFIVDPWWNPAVEAQARDRSHRIGQKNKVISYKFISSDTVEEKIIKLQQRKSSYATDIIQIEENVIKNLQMDDLSILFS